MPIGKFSLDDMAKPLAGYTGADVEAVCREAALIAMRAKRKTITRKHFEEAIDRVRPTVTPQMMEYYEKLQSMLTSGLDSIRRNNDGLRGIESV